MLQIQIIQFVIFVLIKNNTKKNLKTQKNKNKKTLNLQEKLIKDFKKNQKKKIKN